MDTFNLDVAFQGWAREMTSGETDTVAVEFLCAAPLGFVTGDETMIREAIRNLVDNALRHGGGGVSQVTVGGERSGNMVALTVSDDGVGLSEEGRKAALERFRTVSSTSRSGLGMSIVDAVAQGHNGTLTLAPLARGLRVEMVLPIGTAGSQREGSDHR